MPYLKLTKQGIYVVRRVIPPNLRERAGRAEIQVSLGTRDTRQANRKAVPIIAAMDDYLAALEAGHSGPFSYPFQAPAPTLPPDSKREWAIRLLASIQDGLPDPAPYRQQAELARTLAPTPEAADRAIDAITRSFVDQQQEAHTIRQAIDAYLAEKKDIRPKTKYEFERTWGLFAKHAELAFYRSINAVTRRQIVGFKQHLIEQGKSPATINKALSALSVVLRQARRHDWIQNNPASDLSVADTQPETRRLPFDVEQLNKLLTTDVYKLGEWGTRYWLPLLSMFSGARLEEWAQARVEDIREDSGVTFLQVTDEGPGMKVKSRDSKRKIPIHSTLIVLGFIEYVDWLRRNGAQRLFPDLTPYRGVFNHNYSKWFGAHLTSIGLSDNRLVFHSFRHGVKAILRERDLPGKLQDALLGHAPGLTGGDGNTGDQYGRDASGAAYGLRQLQRAVEAITYPGLTLPPKGHPPRAVPAPSVARRKVRLVPPAQTPRQPPKRSRAK